MPNVVPDPTSDDVDRLLAEHPDGGRRIPPRSDVTVHIEVPVDGTTLARLQQRADRDGRSLSELVEDLLRRAA